MTSLKFLQKLNIKAILKIVLPERLKRVNGLDPSIQMVLLIQNR